MHRHTSKQNLGAHVHSCLWGSNNIAVQFLIYPVSHTLTISKRNKEMLSVKSLHLNKVIGNNLLKVNRYKSAISSMLKLIYPFVFMEICFSGQRSKPHTHYFPEGCQCLFMEWGIPFLVLHPCLYATALLPTGVRTGPAVGLTALLTPFLPSRTWPASTGRNISITIWPDFSLVCLQWKS